MSEASVRPGRLAAFRAAVLDEVRAYPDAHPGLLGDEVLVINGARPMLIYVSRWTDELAVERFAGPDWRSAPVTFDGEDDYLVEPLRVRRFVAEAAR